MRMSRRATLLGVAIRDATTYTLSYTGSFTQRQIAAGGAAYALYTFTGSGFLTVTANGKLRGDICLVGGGGAGGRGAIAGTSTANYVPFAGGGGGGGYLSEAYDAVLRSGPVVIGAGGAAGVVDGNQPGGATAYLDFAAAGGGRAYALNAGADNCCGGAGGSGGGGGWYSNVVTDDNAGIGSGIGMTPFGDSQSFPSKHGAGGAGGTGSVGLRSGYVGRGGPGGTDGGNGGVGARIALITQFSAGGEYGGGAGGGAATAGANPGVSGSYYGAGGGGGAARNDNSGVTYLANGGSGYPGVLYIRIAIE